MTVHIYWRAPDGPSDPFQHIGECEELLVAEEMRQVRGELLELLDITLVGFVGTPPKRVGAITGAQFPPGEYEFASDDHGLIGHISLATGDDSSGTGEWYLMAEAENMTWRERGEVSSN
jgi:hypothetical protein